MDRYNLRGTARFPQVEPDANAWLRCPVLRTIDLEELSKVFNSQVRPFTDFDETTEFAQLLGFFEKRYDAVVEAQPDAE